MYTHTHLFIQSKHVGMCVCKSTCKQKYVCIYMYIYTHVHRTVIELSFIETNTTPPHTTPSQNEAHIRSGRSLIRPHLVLIWGWGAVPGPQQCAKELPKIFRTSPKGYDSTCCWGPGMAGSSVGLYESSALTKPWNPLPQW